MFEQVLDLVGDTKKRNKLLEETGILGAMASKVAERRKFKSVKDKEKFEKNYIKKLKKSDQSNEVLVRSMYDIGSLGEDAAGKGIALDYARYIIAQYFKDDLGSLENIGLDALLSGLNVASFGATQPLGKALHSAGKSLAYSELEGRDSSTNYEALLNYLYTTKLKEAVTRKIANDKTGKYANYERYEARLSSNAEGTSLTVNLYGIKPNGSKEFVMGTEPIKFDTSEKIDKNMPIYMSIGG